MAEDSGLTKGENKSPEQKQENKNPVKTKKYRCVAKTFWNSVLYYEGDTVDVPENVTPPEWFKEV